MFVNPFGGSRSASKIFIDHVRPLLEDADIQFTLQGLNFIFFPFQIMDKYVARSWIRMWWFILFQNLFLWIEFAETQYQLHAKEIAKTLDLSKYDGVVCVSGDGILVEVGCLRLLSYVHILKSPIISIFTLAIKLS